MVKIFKLKGASEKEKTLYCCLGESLYAVRILEDALSHSIVLKKTEPYQKNEAELNHFIIIFLNKQKR